ncbi:hypothetical protein C7M84_004459 [Penaeus vannamei]|uniref:Uncharacterized protein n=1 Tax=Penaeus vannamei TaxID=6689 RepID=A0A3R7SVE2_PENVA|nr:hypothetical protein C7M84_004459 [Penaeus vannamei]
MASRTLCRNFGLQLGTRTVIRPCHFDVTSIPPPPLPPTPSFPSFSFSYALLSLLLFFVCLPFLLFLLCLLSFLLFLRLHWPIFSSSYALFSFLPSTRFLSVLLFLLRLLSLLFSSYVFPFLLLFLLRPPFPPPLSLRPFLPTPFLCVLLFLRLPFRPSPLFPPPVLLPFSLLLLSLPSISLRLFPFSLLSFLPLLPFFLFLTPPPPPPPIPASRFLPLPPLMFVFCLFLHPCPLSVFVVRPLLTCPPPPPYPPSLILNPHIFPKEELISLRSCRSLYSQSHARTSPFLPHHFPLTLTLASLLLITFPPFPLIYSLSPILPFPLLLLLLLQHDPLFPNINPPSPHLHFLLLLPSSITPFSSTLTPPPFSFCTRPPTPAPT